MSDYDRRLLFENCRLKAKRVVNPIIDWQDEDVYGFLDPMPAGMEADEETLI